MSTKTMQRKPPTFVAAGAALRRNLGLALRRKPGRRAKDAEAAYGKVVARSKLTPEQHVDALMAALMAAHPNASVLQICSWFDPGFLSRESPQCDPRCDSDARVIIQTNDPGATPIARGPAGNSGGSQQ